MLPPMGVGCWGRARYEVGWGATVGRPGTVFVPDGTYLGDLVGAHQPGLALGTRSRRHGAAATLGARSRWIITWLNH